MNDNDLKYVKKNLSLLLSFAEMELKEIRKNISMNKKIVRSEIAIGRIVNTLRPMVDIIERGTDDQQ